MQILKDRVLRTTFMCSKVCAMIERGELRLDHSQQRKPGQWVNEDRDNFIVSVLLNEDFDSIKICEQVTKTGIDLYIIDGIQKMTIIQDYKSGKFALGKKIAPNTIEYQMVQRDENGAIIKDEDDYPTYQLVSCQLSGKSYQDLPQELKERFDNCPVDIIKHLDCSPEEVGRHIYRYNSGKRMTSAQRIVTYTPSRASYIKKLANHPFFNDCANFSATKDKNGTTDKVICETVLFNNCFNKWSSKVNKMGELLERDTSVEMFERFGKQLDRLLEIITPSIGEKFFTSKNALLFFKLYDEFEKRGCSDAQFIDFLNKFEKIDRQIEVEHEYEIKKGSGKKVTKLSFAEIDAAKSSKDKGLLTDKLHILEALMEDYFKYIDALVDDTPERAEGVHTEFANSNNADSTENVGQIDQIDNENRKNVSEKEEAVNKKESEPDDLAEFVTETTNLGTDDEDLKNYEDFIEDTVRISSPLYQKCKPALLAMAAYVYSIDKDDIFQDWVGKYQNEKTDFNVNQTRNYTYMKNDFENYMQNTATA